MRIKNDQDFVTGLMFLVIGLGALAIAYDFPSGQHGYTMGTPQRPGTGVLPAILSWCLIGSGLLIAGKSIGTPGAAMGIWDWRSIICVTLGTVAFGLVIDDWGLIVSMILSMTLCALGTPETRWREFAIFSGIMLAIGYSTFIWLLGMPIATWPTKLVPSQIAGIFQFFFR